jgi:hypothetical protein
VPVPVPVPARVPVMARVPVPVLVLVLVLVLVQERALAPGQDWCARPMGPVHFASARPSAPSATFPLSVRTQRRRM